jgi:hypothetical protein
MKNLIVLLVGFGAILLAGGVECALAEGGQSVFSGSNLSDDSLKALSLRARRDLIYMEPELAPARPGKVAGEFVAGGLSSVVFGAVGARIGYSMTYDDGDGFLNFSGLPGAIFGYLLCSNLGCAAGVTLVGNTGGEKGSYWASFGGSVVGTLVGGVCAFGIAAATDCESAWAPTIVLVAAQAGGATMGFNRSRKRISNVPSDALLNLSDGKLSLAPPRVNVSQDSFNSTSCQVTLFEATF